MNRMRTSLIFVGVAAALATVLACSTGGSDDGPRGGTGVGPVTTNPATAAQAAPTGPFTSFGDGQYEVGSQPGMVKPGKYRTTVPANSGNCYWERQKDLSGGFDAIIANNNHKPGEPIVLTILATDKGFASRGCGEWRLSP
jgi:hypothetical protein